MTSPKRDQYLAAPADRFGRLVSGLPHAIGAGFSATLFSEEMFDGAMDPLLMVDHFVMTRPTFEPHLHAGLSAVTMLFEDTEGAFLNRDTLGNSLELRAGDLYWLAAASGAVHEEKPAAGARIHGLQIFVNLAGSAKKAAATSFKVDATQMPVVEGVGHRVRIVLGSSGGVIGQAQGTGDLTVLDARFQAEGRFAHALPSGHQGWIYAIAGSLGVRCGDEKRVVPSRHATTIRAGGDVDVCFEASDRAHAVVLAGKPVNEPFVKYGPLVMPTFADVQRTLAQYAAGKFGRIPA